MAKAWLITGCSTGIGRALAQRVLAHGDRCVVTARNIASIADIVVPYPDTSLALSLDVRDAAQRKHALAQAVERFGGLDVLVNNAGHGYSAAVRRATRRRSARCSSPTSLVLPRCSAMRCP